MGGKDASLVAKDVYTPEAMWEWGREIPINHCSYFLL